MILLFLVIHILNHSFQTFCIAMFQCQLSGLSKVSHHCIRSHNSLREIKPITKHDVKLSLSLGHLERILFSASFYHLVIIINDCFDIKRGLQNTSECTSISSLTYSMQDARTIVSCYKQNTKCVFAVAKVIYLCL